MKKAKNNAPESASNIDTTKIMLKTFVLALLGSLLPPLLGAGLGYLIDYFTGTYPLALIIGVCLGVLVACIFIIWQIVSIRRENKK